MRASAAKSARWRKHKRFCAVPNRGLQTQGRTATHEPPLIKCIANEGRDGTVVVGVVLLGDVETVHGLVPEG